MAMRLLLLCVLWFSLRAFSQEALPPQYKIGDRWVFERFDLAKKEVTASRETRVVEIGPATVKFEQRDLSTGRVTPVITDREGNTLQVGNAKYDSKNAIYSFPLSVGKKWAYKISGDWIDGASTFTAEIDCEVLAHEDVETKAGTFKAYQIRCEGNYVNTRTSSGERVAGRTSGTRWYSPAVKTFVKYELRDTWRGSAYNQYVDRLVSFELQK